MIIALVSQEYPPGRHGGIGAQTVSKALGMVQRGHQVHVVTHSHDGREHQEDQDGIAVHRIPGADTQLTIQAEEVRWLTYSVRVAEKLSALCQQHAFDLVDFPEWAGEGFVHLLNRTAGRSPAVVVQLHGPLVMFAHTMGWPAIDSKHYEIGTLMERTTVQMADAVYSSSQCSIDWCAQHYGLDPGPVPVLHTGVDTLRLQPAPAAVKSAIPTVVFVGKLVRNKGVLELVEAFCRLRRRHPTCRLLLAGAGEAAVRAAIEQLAARDQAQDAVQCLDFVSREALPSLLASAHVFAAPSIYEGGPGFVYLEAMACGLPVIGCAGSGAAEAITHESTGLLVPPRDVPALEQALERLLFDTETQQRMSAAARQYVVQNADSRSCLDQLEAFYLSATAASSRRCGNTTEPDEPESL